MFATKEMDESMERDFVESVSNLLNIQYIIVHGGLWVADTAMWEAAGFVLSRPLQHLEWPSIELSKLPSCINPSRLPNLSHLRLRVTTVDEKDLKLLARLPALCFLSLETESAVTSNINASDGCCFQKLRYFRISAMVQFEHPNEEDASVSLHIWNGEGAMPFGSGKSNEDSNKVAPFGVMPNLEELCISIPLRALKDNNGDCGNIGLEYLPSLRQLSGSMDCDGASAGDVNAALAGLRNACNVHPNHLTLDMHKHNKEKMVSQDKEDEKQQQEAEMASQAVNLDLGELSPACS